MIQSFLVDLSFGLFFFGVEQQEAIAMGSTKRSEYHNLWKEYISSRPYLASTPEEEAASILCRNRKALTTDTMKRIGKDLFENNETDMDTTLRQLAYVLIEKGKTGQISNVQESLGMESMEAVASLASFLDERMCVPRDMGEPCAAAFKALPLEIQSQP